MSYPDSQSYTSFADSSMLIETAGGKNITCPYCGHFISISNTNISLKICPNCSKKIKLKFEKSASSNIRGDFDVPVSTVEHTSFKLYVGFLVLLIIWAIEAFDEYDKLQTMTILLNGDELPESEYRFCQEDNYDASKCSEWNQREAVDNQKSILWMKLFEIIAWITVFAGILDFVQDKKRNATSV